MPDSNDQQQGVFSRDVAEVAQDIAAGVAVVAGAVGRGLQVGAQEVAAVADRLGVARIPITSSSCISELAYHLASGDMEVTFQDGSVYFYPSVHMIDFLRFLNARSKGSHYNRFWRGKENLIQGKKKGSHMALGGNR